MWCDTFLLDNPVAWMSFPGVGFENAPHICLTWHVWCDISQLPVLNWYNGLEAFPGLQVRSAVWIIWQRITFLLHAFVFYPWVLVMDSSQEECDVCFIVWESSKFFPVKCLSESHKLDLFLGQPTCSWRSTVLQSQTSSLVSRRFGLLESVVMMEQCWN